MFNKLPHMIKVYRNIQDAVICVGVPRDDKFLNMVACVNETGTTIHAKNYPFLWIPTHNAKGRKASQIPGLYVRKKQGADHAAAGYDDASQPYGFCVCFVLKKSVHIPRRAFLQHCIEENLPVWNAWANRKAWQAAVGRITLKSYFLFMKDHMVNDLKDTITKWSKPPNAPLTLDSENKKESDPLVDTGRMRKSIEGFVIRERID